MLIYNGCLFSPSLLGMTARRSVFWIIADSVSLIRLRRSGCGWSALWFWSICYRRRKRRLWGERAAHERKEKWHRRDCAFQASRPLKPINGAKWTFRKTTWSEMTDPEVKRFIHFSVTTASFLSWAFWGVSQKCNQQAKCPHKVANVRHSYLWRDRLLGLCLEVWSGGLWVTIVEDQTWQVIYS